MCVNIVCILKGFEILQCWWVFKQRSIWTTGYFFTQHVICMGTWVNILFHCNAFNLWTCIKCQRLYNKFVKVWQWSIELLGQGQDLATWFSPSLKLLPSIICTKSPLVMQVFEFILQWVHIANFMGIVLM